MPPAWFREMQKEFLKILPKLYKMFRELDAELAEINPLALTPKGLIAADAKVTIDDDALIPSSGTAAG
jgi:succinyl-CoA synthetase beta subunit